MSEPTNAPSIKFPKEWKPYPFQIPLWRYLLSGGKTAVAVWHRRAGKDLLGLHWIISAALRSVGVYWYVFPSYEQAKHVIWDGITLDGKPYLSYIPSSFIKRKQQHTNTLVLHNDSVIRFLGADRDSSLRGAGIRGAVLSEYSFQNPKTHFSVIQPMIKRSDGWLLYLYTPCDKKKMKHGEDLFFGAQGRDGWFVERKTIEDTTDHDGNPLITSPQLHDLRRTGMTEAQIQREFFCDFMAERYIIKEDSVFGSSLDLAEAQGRIGAYPYIKEHKVDLYWDIGVVDYTVIWFVQELPDKIVFIDFFLDKNQTIDYYIKHLKTMPYKYGKNIIPFESGYRTILSKDKLIMINEEAQKYNFPLFECGSYVKKERQYTAAKELLRDCCFDRMRCAVGLECLRDYTAKKSAHSGSKKENDVADAFCYAALSAVKGDARKASDEVFDDMRTYGQVVKEYNTWDY